MGAWGMLDLDDPSLDRFQRRNFMRAIQDELRNYGYQFHVTHSNTYRGLGQKPVKRYRYALKHLMKRGTVAQWVSGTNVPLREACLEVLNKIEPSNPDNSEG
jgi:hypothetical protein